MKKLFTFLLAITFGLSTGVYAALETGTYINSLVATNPTSSDQKAQGDDHIRLIKSTLLATFPNVTGAVTATQAQLNGPVSGTATASTSGTSIDYTSIPSWAKRITVQFSGVSINATDSLVVQIGDSGGIESTSYTSLAYGGQNAAYSVSLTSAGFTSLTGTAVSTWSGSVVLTLMDASTNKWTASAVLMDAAGFRGCSIAGDKSLSAALDRVRITTSNGTATFDAGTVNIQFD